MASFAFFVVVVAVVSIQLWIIYAAFFIVLSFTALSPFSTNNNNNDKSLNEYECFSSKTRFVISALFVIYACSSPPRPTAASSTNEQISDTQTVWLVHFIESYNFHRGVGISKINVFFKQKTKYAVRISFRTKMKEFWLDDWRELQCQLFNANVHKRRDDNDDNDGGLYTHLSVTIHVYQNAIWFDLIWSQLKVIRYYFTSSLCTSTF